MNFTPRTVVTLSETVTRPFPALGCNFELRNVNYGPYKEAMEAQQKLVSKEATKVYMKAAVKGARFSPKHPPKGMKGKPGRDEIQEHVLSGEVDRMEVPDAVDEDVFLLLVASCDGLVNDDKQEVEWSIQVGKDILSTRDPAGNSYLVPAEVCAATLGREINGSMAIEDLFRLFVVEVAQDEDAFSGATSSPKG